ncbi:hypothetical protein DFQ11_101413 [Winogradskyella epiphytica]|uniref:Uncharacterized protein n=1 Tax=Winogradskyella epiphytica TaxID=262005 RepID=A0A2V4YGD5_9FLAO|nr:hypothetical protein [Winogradskyella epiphytica]PYE82983.1 hypothetical protein DFQ11_101413 [Winogradskyella epiphytica]GGW54986.1 hypothetical protein GCM10008085_02820 [Winogradskyella epiphytica]
MKTLKITLALVAVLLLTVSVVNRESVTTVADVDTEIKERSTKIDLLAHRKTKLSVPTRG